MLAGRIGACMLVHAMGPCLGYVGEMRELISTTDPVLLSFVQSLMHDAGIEAVVFDQHISIVEGSIGAFPRRLMVPEASWDEAAVLLREAGVGEWIVSSETG